MSGGDGAAPGPGIAVVGDVFLDVDLDGAVNRLCPDAPAPVVDGARESARPGGAGLAALMIARDGHPVTLVAALGDDTAAARVRPLLERSGVRVIDMGAGGTTAQKTRIRAGGRVLARVDRGGPPALAGDPPDEAVAALEAAGAVLVADYGYGVAAHPALRAVIADLTCPVVWDPHPRGPRPVPGVALVTPNHAEAAGMGGPGAEPLRTALAAGAVAVTRGPLGAELADGLGAAIRIPAPRVIDPHADTLGAGDRFAGAATCALARGASVAAAVEEALRSASAFVADGGVEGLVRGPGREDAIALAARVRERGGTVVATGGCFDLVHAGHVASLAAARSLGDCLVVLVNSDASVRRLKGPGRPVVGQEDRAALLSALRSVDAVMLFDEDTPEDALRRLRPHVFAKGADYDPALLPEAEVMRALGGRVEALPFMPGRSTTRLIEEVVANGA